MFVMQTAERVIETLRAHEKELRQAGLRSISLFGSLGQIRNLVPHRLVSRFMTTSGDTLRTLPYSSRIG